MATRFKHNVMEIVTEVLASVARAQKSGVKVTMGQVEKNLINVRLPRTQVKETLEHLYCWGLLERFNYDYRKNVKTYRYEICMRYQQMQIIKSLVMYHQDLAPYFPAWKEEEK